MDPTIPVDVDAISSEVGGSMYLERTLELTAFSLRGQELQFLAPVHIEVSVSNAGDCYVATGRVSTEVLLACSRCLEPVQHPVDSPLDRCYRTDPDTVLEEDPDMESVHEGIIDLWPAVSATVAESVPFAPLCDDACPGICPHCGSDLSKGDCGCVPESPESPFSILQGFVAPGDDDRLE